MKTQIKLVVRTDHPSRSMGIYGHIRLYVRVESWDECTQKFLWASGMETVDGLYVKNLEVNNQCDENDHASISYGWSLEYREVHTVDLREAKAMASTLATLEKRIQKLRDTLGYPTTYGQYVARAAVAMKVKSIVFIRERDGDGQDIGELELTPGDAQGRIDRDTLTLVNECRKLANKECLAA